MISLKQTTRLLLLSAALVLASAAFTQKAAAQCAMCKAVLESSTNGAAFIKQLKIGIIVLLIPPVGIFCTAFGFAYKYRNFSHANDDGNPED